MLQSMLSLMWGHPFVSLLVLLAVSPLLTGAVFVRERQVGIVVKRFSRTALAPGQLIALHGEAGYQAETLAPGVHFGYWFWQYSVHKVPVTVIPQGEIGLVVAADGAAMPPHRILGHVVACDNFQDAHAFLRAGGEKGRQIGLLTAGTYRIHTRCSKSSPRATPRPTACPRMRCTSTACSSTAWAS